MLGHKVITNHPFVQSVRSRFKGFTLVELLVVIAIITILSAVGFVFFKGVSDQTADAKKKSDVLAIAKAYETNYSQGYSALQDTWFASGVKPQPKSGVNYFTEVSGGGLGFRVCANLDDDTQCTTPSSACFCKDSTQGTYLASVLPPPPGGPTPPPPPGGGSSDISFKGSYYNNVGATNSIVLRTPYGTQAGNVMVAQACLAAAGSTTIGSSAAGWTQIIQTQVTGANVYCALFWKPATSSDLPGITNYTFNFTGVSGGIRGQILSYANVNTVTPIDGFDGKTSSSNSTITNPGPAVSPTGSNDMLVFYGYAVGAAFTIANSPTGMITRLNTVPPGSPTGGGMISGDQLLTSAGNTGPRATTASGPVSSIAQMIALRNSPSPTPTPSPTPSPFPQIPLGASFGTAYMNDSAYAAILVNNAFGSITPENEMKMDAVKFNKNSFNYTKADEIVNLAQAYGLRVHGHASIWFMQLPTWFINEYATYTQQDFKDIMNDFVTTTMDRYEGRVQSWDVVNEAYTGGGLRPCGPPSDGFSNAWNCMGSITSGFPQCTVASPCNFVDYAFLLARAADPNAKLYYNDFGTELIDYKSDHVYNMVVSMKNRGIPIDGVGFQSHVTYNYPTLTYANVLANLTRFNNLGVAVKITEADVQVMTPTPDANLLNAQANVFANILAKACKDAPNCTGFTVWGLTDRYSWIQNDAPLLFNATSPYSAKPAYGAVKSILGL